jgi:hypothetical protein
MLSRARLYADAAMEMTYMDISYEAHLARHPPMHVFAVTLDSDLNPSLHDMRQEFLRRMVVQDGRMNVFVMREYLYGMRVRPLLSPLPPPPPTEAMYPLAVLYSASLFTKRCTVYHRYNDFRCNDILGTTRPLTATRPTCRTINGTSYYNNSATSRYNDTIVSDYAPCCNEARL